MYHLYMPTELNFRHLFPNFLNFILSQEGTEERCAMAIMPENVEFYIMIIQMTVIIRISKGVSSLKILLRTIHEEMILMLCLCECMLDPDGIPKIKTEKYE